MLIILGGLPGVGKTTVAKQLAKQLKAVYLRVDTAEQVLRETAQLNDPEGYMVCYALALENLRLGMTVIAASANTINITREAWINVAEQASTPFVEVELMCSNLAEHQKRIETREADISNLKLPSWQAVLDREYEPWTSKHLVFDTSKQSIDKITQFIITSIK
ncbi:MAG: AAA family ATPase [Gammaproteobacteria bacterium]|nr:AAA family ATPase [Gammaproteobacteria bacterium]